MKHLWLVVLLGCCFGTAAADVAEVFPEPLPGWEAGEVEVSKYKEEFSGFHMTGYRMERGYRDAQNHKLNILIDTAACESTAIVSTMHENAQVRRDFGSGMRPVSIKGYMAMERYNGQGRRELVGVSLDACGMVFIGGPDLPAETGVLDAYLERTDFEEIDMFLLLLPGLEDEPRD